MRVVDLKNNNNQKLIFIFDNKNTYVFNPSSEVCLRLSINTLNALIKRVDVCLKNSFNKKQSTNSIELRGIGSIRFVSNKNDIIGISIIDGESNHASFLTDNNNLELFLFKLLNAEFDLLYSKKINYYSRGYLIHNVIDDNIYMCVKNSDDNMYFNKDMCFNTNKKNVSDVWKDFVKMCSEFDK